jgi:hypothetical protein
MIQALIDNHISKGVFIPVEGTLMLLFPVSALKITI